MISRFRERDEGRETSTFPIMFSMGFRVNSNSDLKGVKMKKIDPPKKDTMISRRNFLKTAAVGAAVAAAAVKTGHSALAAEEEGQPIRLAKDFSDALTRPPLKVDFPMTGADVFAKACLDEGLSALFLCPGNYTIAHAMINQGIPAIGGRHEGQMAKAADGFIRVSGEVAACSGTEGPGFSQMIDSIAAANAARTPLLAVASNMAIMDEDSEKGIQLIYQQPLTEGLKKWGKRLITPSRVYEYATYAFRQLKSGVPKPVHLDFPSEVAGAKFNNASELVRYFDKSKYRTEAKTYPDPKQIQAAADLLKKAQRPMIVASTGVFYHKAIDILKKFAEKTQIPVTYTGPMRGIFSDGHPLSAGTAMSAYLSADVVMMVGQYCMPVASGGFGGGWSTFNPNVKYIRIDLSPEDMGRNLPLEVGIISDEKVALEALYNETPSMTHDSWIAEIAAARQKFENENADMYRVGKSYNFAVHPAVILTELTNFIYRGKIPKEQTVTNPGGMGTLIYANRFFRAYRPGQETQPAYQFAHIGATLGMSVGVAAAVKWGVGHQAPYKGAPSVVVDSDAGFAYAAMELDTMAKYRLPVIVIIYNNNAWSTYSSAKGKPAEHVHLFQENLRYDKIAEGLGGHGEYVTKPEGFLPALERCWKIAETQNLPSVINCQGIKEFWEKDKYPPGIPAIIEPGVISYTH